MRPLACLGLALLLSGCLLPQPDTPILPPFLDSGRAAPENATGAAPVAAPVPPLAALVSVTIEAPAGVEALVAEPSEAALALSEAAPDAEPREPAASAPPIAFSREAAGRWRAELPAGRYSLIVAAKDGTARLELAVEAEPASQAYALSREDGAWRLTE